MHDVPHSLFDDINPDLSIQDSKVQALMRTLIRDYPSISLAYSLCALLRNNTLTARESTPFMSYRKSTDFYNIRDKQSTLPLAKERRQENVNAPSPT